MEDLIYIANKKENVSGFGDRNLASLRKEDRRYHAYIIGKTGTGKSTLLKNLIIQDIREGRGVGVLDPHGDLVEDVLNFIPSPRIEDTVYFNPQDYDYPIGFNILKRAEGNERPLLASNLISIFKNIWIDSWGPRLEYILYNSIVSLLESSGSTLLHIPRLLTDKNFRMNIIQKLEDPVVKDFWLNEFEKHSDNFRREAISPIQNKVGQFLNSAIVRNIVSQTKNKVDFESIIQNKRIFLANLSKGKLGEDKSNILGSMLITKFFLESLKQVDKEEAERRDFYFYIDECQNFSTAILSEILSEARKYRLNLILTNQYLDQLSEDVRKGIFGNVGTLISFRLGAEDAKTLEKEFLSIQASHLEKMDNYNIAAKLIENGKNTAAFHAKTLSLFEKEKNEGNKETVIKVSRERYAIKREVIEGKIKKWLSRNNAHE